MKKLNQWDFESLKKGYPVCPRYLNFTVGKEYLIQNPSNKDEKILARCTQNCPISIIKID